MANHVMLAGKTIAETNMATLTKRLEDRIRFERIIGDPKLIFTQDDVYKWLDVYGAYAHGSLWYRWAGEQFWFKGKHEHLLKKNRENLRYHTSLARKIKMYHTHYKGMERNVKVYPDADVQFHNWAAEVSEESMAWLTSRKVYYDPLYASKPVL